MVQIEGDNIKLVYAELLREVLRRGKPQGSRIGGMVEIEHATVHLTAPTRALASGMGRGLSSAVVAMESLQLIAGENDAELMCEVAPQFESYRNGPGTRFHGGYGDRTGEQIEEVVDTLIKRPDSRQAVVNIWDYNRRDLGAERWGEKDTPCTVALQFRLRDGRLNLSTFMRSNDAWLGFPYDIAQFCALQCSVAHVLGAQPGTYWHTAGSMHLYQSDTEAVLALLNNILSMQMHASVRELTGVTGSPVRTVQEIQLRAIGLMQGIHMTNETPSETWYREAIRKALQKRASND